MNRRAFLNLLAKVGVLSMASTRPSMATVTSDTLFSEKQRFEFSKETDQLGRIYLAAYPDDVSCCQRMRLELEDLSTAKQQKVWQTLLMQVRHDFLQGNIVKLHGWVLSRTELRLATLNVL
jgi:hypothetical protein